MKKSFLLSFAFLFLSAFSFAAQGNYFVPNKGQIIDMKGNKHPEIHYKYEGSGLNLYFQNDRLTYHFIQSEEKKEQDYTEQDRENRRNGNFAAIGKKVFFYRLDLHFKNANPAVEIIAEDLQQSFSNYYLPACPQGLLNLSHYGKITYKNLYEGIDLSFYFSDGKLKYDFIVAPGADAAQIRLVYEGAKDIERLSSGELLIKTPAGDLKEGTPYTFEQRSGIEIPSSYLLENMEVGFDLGDKHPGNTIIIDPTLTWSTYFNNGSSSDTWTKPAFDNTGAFYNCAYTYYTTFPLLNAGGGQYFDSSKDGITDLVVVKFASNYAYAWATYYGGDGGEYVAGYTDYGKALAVDASNNVYFAGQTDGTTFPTFNPGGGAFYQDQTRIFSETAFIVKLNSSGVRQWASIFQHENANTMSGSIRINGITVGNNQLYFTGQTYRFNSNDVPLRTLAGAYNNSAWRGPQDVFIGRFTSTCALEWCTYLNDGGLTNASYRQGCDLTMDVGGNLWFVGRHSSNAANAGHYLLNSGGGTYYQGFNNGDQDLIITKFNSTMNVVHSTYYGGNDQDIPSMINCNSLGEAVIPLRAARSTNFPVYDPGGSYYQPVKAYISSFDSDAAIIKFAATFHRQWATYYGGSAGPSLFSGVGFDASNNIYVFGSTQASNFPLQNDGVSYYDGTMNGSGDVVLLRFNTSGARQWSSFFGGSGYESLYSPKGEVASSGCSVKLLTFPQSGSTDYPTVNPGGGAFYETTALTANVNAILLMQESSSSGNSTAPTSATASAPTICSGGSTTLSVSGGSLGTGASWTWYSGSCGGTLVGTGASLAVSPTATTTYFVRAEGTCNTTTCQSVTVTVNTLSVAPTSAAASSPTICSGGSTTLSVSGGSLGTGASWTWYSGSCGGTLVGTGASLAVSPTATTTYFVRAEGTCNTTTCQSVTVTVNTLSVAPTSAAASSPTICSGGSTTLSISGGTLGTAATWNWYTGSCGGTLVGTGASLAVNPTSTTTYFVRAEGTCNTTTCQSVTVTVNTLSVAPTSAAASSPTICSGGSTTLSVSGGSLGTGASWTWYTGSCGGTLAGTGASLAVSPTSTTTYFVRAEGTCNTTTCQSVTVTVNTLSVAPTSAAASSPTICSGSSTTLSVSGGTLGTAATWNWYTGSCGGTLVGTGASLSVNPTATTTYYVRAEGTCNTTTCQSVTVTVNTLSVAATSAAASSPTICSGSSTTLSVSGGSLGTGANWNWYSGSCGGTLVGTGASLAISPTATTTYFVRAEGTCNTTTCQSVTVTVNTLSVAPTSAAASSPTICSGSSTTLSVSGGTLGTAAIWNWYEGSCGGTLVGTGASLAVSPTSTTTYFVRAEGTCNTTTCQSVTVTVNTLSVAATSATASAPTICSGSSTTLSVSGGSLGTSANWNWYEGSCGGTLVGTGTSVAVSPTSTTTYFVRAEGTCNTTSCESITITVNENSIAATGIIPSATAVCTGNTVTLTVDGGSLGTAADWSWYTGSCNGTPAGTGTSITVPVNAATDFFVNASGTCNTTSCAFISIGTLPGSTLPVLSASADSVCPLTPVTLSMSGETLEAGASWAWYSGSCGGIPEGTGSSITVTSSVTTTYFVRAEGGSCGNSSCVPVTVNVSSISIAADSITSTADTICPGTTVTLSAQGGNPGTAAQYAWYEGSCNGTFLGNGTSITVNPASTTSYFVNLSGSCNTTSCQQFTVHTLILNAAPSLITATDTNLCSGGTITLAVGGGSLGTGGEWQWFSGSCGGTPAGTGDSIFINPSAPTSYFVLAAGGCNTTACAQIDIDAIPLPATWNAPAAICSSQGSIDLSTLLLPGTLTTGTWSGPGVSGSMFNPSGIIDSAVISYIAGAGICMDSVSHAILIHTAPLSPVVSQSADSICAGEPVTLSATGGGTGVTYNVYDSPTGGTLLGSTPLIVTPGATTSYYIEAMDSTGCINSGGREIVTVTASPLPLADAGTDVTICEGTPATLTASGGGTYLWSTSESSASISVMPSSNTSYHVTVNIAGCSATDTVLVNVITGADVMAADNHASTDQGVSITVNPATNDSGDPLTITIVSGPTNGTATVDASGNVEYTPAGSFSGTDSISYSICHASCANICTTAKIYILVKGETTVSVPGGISPNGDGINEVWNIKGLDNYPENKVIIFNRWGDEVFSASPYLNDWSGQSNNPTLRVVGNQVVDGTYFYILQLKPEEKGMNGTIELIRK